MSRLPSRRCSGVPASPRKLKPVGMPCPIVLGVEDDHAALLHVGVDLGERRFGNSARVGKHGPVEQGIEGDLVALDVDGERLARLHRRARDQELVEADQALAAGLVGGPIAGEDVAET